MSRAVPTIFRRNYFYNVKDLSDFITGKFCKIPYFRLLSMFHLLVSFKRVQQLITEEARMCPGWGSVERSYFIGWFSWRHLTWPWSDLFFFFNVTCRFAAFVCTSYFTSTFLLFKCIICISCSKRMADEFRILPKPSFTLSYFIKLQMAFTTG